MFSFDITGPMNEKLNFIKAELARAKQAIGDKVRKDREELVAKTKVAVDRTDELAAVVKRLEETESKFKEKETRIAQMINFINSNKTRLQAQKKQVDELTKEVADLKAAAAVVAVAPGTSLARPAEASVDTVPKSDMDMLKSKYLQSKFEIERLKRELETTNGAATATNANPTASVRDGKSQFLNQ